MPIFWKAFILIVTIYLYNSFSAYHVNKWNNKNHKPFKENNVIMRIVIAIWLFFKALFPRKKIKNDKIKFIKRISLPFVVLSPREICVNKPFLRLKVLFMYKIKFLFLYVCCCFLYYFEILLLPVVFVVEFTPFRNSYLIDSAFKLLSYQKFLLFVEAFILIYFK